MLSITQKQLELPENAVVKRLSEKQEKCLQLFRLTTGALDATYEWYKDRAGDRVEGTCGWFLNHANFQKWLKQESGPLLVSANPGCGKLVLARYLIDVILPQSSVIYHFFFKDQDQNINILEQALNNPIIGPMIIMLDTLDKCAESEFKDLIQNLKRYSLQSDSRKLKFLLTSRLYKQIVDGFRGLLHAFPHIRIPGEESHIIQYRAKQVTKEKGLSELVYLMFNYLKATPFKKTIKGVDFTISTLPANVNEVYEQILNKSKDQMMVRRALSIILAASRPLTISKMNIALNVNVTLNCIHDIGLEENENFMLRLRTVCGLFVSIHHDKIYFLHQTAREFLLADIVSPIIGASGLLWQNSITSQGAHNLLAEICLVYRHSLNGDNISQELKSESEEGDHVVDPRAFLGYAASNWGYNDILITSYFGIEAAVKVQLEKGAAFDYEDSGGRTPLSWAARYGHETIAKLLLEKGAAFDLCDNLALLLLDRGIDVNFRLHGRSCTARMKDLLVTYDIDERFESLISNNPSVGLTALQFTALNGIMEMTALLIAHGADLNALDVNGDTPLHLAIRSQVQGHKCDDLWVGGEYAVEALSGYITDYEGKEASDIWAAIDRARENTIRQLLNSQVIDVNLANNAGELPLHVIPFVEWRAHHACAVLTLLLDHGVEVSSLNMDRQTCLHLASKAGNLDVVRILLERGCDITLLDKDSLSPVLRNNAYMSIRESDFEFNYKPCRSIYFMK
ncbi:hypothetical protein N7507_004275 [Penicillium longicatenatum]|nr:hypothetical protein N7507_004275 [Penicillium longicatenatum]